MRTDCLTYEHSLCFDSISSAPPDNRELRVLFFHDELLSEHDIGVKFAADIPNGRNGDVPGFQQYSSEYFHRDDYLNESSTTQVLKAGLWSSQFLITKNIH